jgi:L-rhamnonate dehydratase
MKQTNRRGFLKSSLAALAGLAAGAGSAPSAPWPVEDGLAITDVRLVRTRPRNPLPRYEPVPGSYWANREAARPITIYPEYTGRRGPGSTWMPEPGALDAFTVEVSTNKGLKGYGRGGHGGGPVVEGNLRKLLVGKNPLDIERLWDVMWRATLFYGRAGAAVHGISGVDLALWDLAGKAFGVPVYKLLGGRTWERVPAYATGNDIEQSLEFGYTKVKLALQHGPGQGREGLKKNAAQVKRTRELIGPDGHIMIDCWMALDEVYTLQLAEAVAPYDVHWLEEVLQPDEYEGFARLNTQLTSTLLATGEHEYTRHGFGRLLHYKAVDIWQPEIMYCGGMSEMRRIGTMAQAHGIPLIPHAGGGQETIHYLATLPQTTWAETTIPAPGGPDRVYKMFEEQRLVSRGPEGIYFQPSEEPGFGWDFDVAN